MALLYKVNKMVKDKRKGAAFRKLKVTPIKTMKRVSQMTINPEAVAKTLF